MHPSIAQYMFNQRGQDLRKQAIATQRARLARRGRRSEECRAAEARSAHRSSR